MKVKCDKCREEVASSNIDLNRNIAKCDKCGEIFNCADQLDDIASYGLSTHSRSEIPLPQNVKIEHTLGGLLITRRWMEPALFGLLLFCIFWDGFMITWYTIAIVQKEWGMAAFGTLHALVGIGLTYGLVCGFVNRTEIHVTQGKLQIDHLPLPLPMFKTREVVTSQIAQLYTKRNISRGDDTTNISYALRMKTTDGKDVKLIEHLSEQDHGLYIEQQIERYLGISDTPVGGEVERY